MHLPIFICIYLLSIYLSIHLSLYPSMYLSTYPSVYLPIGLPTYCNTRIFCVYFTFAILQVLTALQIKDCNYAMY